MEIEAKYSVLSDKTYGALRSLPELAGCRLTPGRLLHLRDQYFDTSDHRILSGGYAFRLRYQDDRTYYSLKSLGGVSGSVHRREEIEYDVPEADFDRSPGDWLPEPLWSILSELTESQPLVNILTIRQERHERRLLAAAEDVEVATVALDNVEIVQDASTSQRFVELEIELAQDRTEEELEPIVAELTRMRGLVPQPASKFERGLAFVSRTMPVEHDGTKVKPDDTIGRAMTKILRPLFTKMQDHEQGSYAGVDTEELHDMRVATRRMRTAFWIADPYLDGSELKKVRKGLARTADALGAVRDMDVFRDKTDSYLAEHDSDLGGFAPLFRVWDVEYIRRRNEMLEHLSSKAYARFKKRFWASLQEGIPDKREAREVAAVLRQVVEERLEAVLRHDTALVKPGQPLSRYHELRIDVKRLRYTLEFFRDVLGDEALMVIEALKVLQDFFGDLQDARVASAHLRAVITFGTWEAPEQVHALWSSTRVSGTTLRTTSPDLAVYLAAREAEIERLVDQAPATWAAFQASGAPQLVRGAIGHL